MTPRLPILTYHSVDGSGSVISVSPTRFRWQMDHLHGLGWRTLTLDEIMHGRTLADWPAKAFALTFDDAFDNFARCALPILKRCGYSAIVFPVSDWVGDTNDWPSQPAWVPRQKLLDWEGLRMIADLGMEVGAHSVSHPRLTHLPADDSRREIGRCREVIEARLGRPVRAFAYPYGDSSPQLESTVAEHYALGFGTRLGFVTPASRLTCAERIDAFYLRSPSAFRALSAGWLRAYLALRRWLRLLRLGARRGLTGGKPIWDCP